MKTKLLGLIFLAGGAMFAQTRVSIGVNIGGYGYGPRYYAPAPVYAAPVYAPVYAQVPVRVVRPPCPGPGFGWVDGYWNTNRWGRSWVNGYWTRARVAQRYHYYNYDRRDYDRYDRGYRRYRR